MAGIWPTPVSGLLCTVKVSSEGQLGCNAGEDGGEKGAMGATGPEGKEGKTGATGPAGDAAIATFASFGGVASGHCLNYTVLAGQGQSNCAPPTSGWSNSNVLTGPMPLGGATCMRKRTRR
jgi:hypothetical protein